MHRLLRPRPLASGPGDLRADPARRGIDARSRTLPGVSVLWRSGPAGHFDVWRLAMGLGPYVSSGVAPGKLASGSGSLTPRHCRVRRWDGDPDGPALR